MGEEEGEEGRRGAGEEGRMGAGDERPELDWTDDSFIFNENCLTLVQLGSGLSLDSSTCFSNNSQIEKKDFDEKKVFV